jgi:hypothetical protein
MIHISGQYDMRFDDGSEDLQNIQEQTQGLNEEAAGNTMRFIPGM